MRIETRHKISALFLLAVMLSMLFCVSLHRHEYRASVEETCADCLHHVHHAGHVTAQTINFHECILCQLHSLPYLMPSILHLAVAICVTHAVYMFLAEKCRNHVDGIYSPRAPPCLYYNY